MLGDDNLFASDTLFTEDAIKTKYREYGLDVKVVVKEGNPYRSKFLQCYLVPVSVMKGGNQINTHCLYRNPGRAIL